MRRVLVPEIQGLRAVAVGLVLAFHIWPWLLTGGYVGVDVFFVISGYLITNSLMGSIARNGRLSLLDFYARRVRRLMPAAMTVLALTLAATFILLPEARWRETATEIAASALNVENWLLAALAVDYLEAGKVGSPVQHYWSLSIEEQFYLVWPLLMVTALYLARKLDYALRPTLAAVLAVLFTGSFIASLVITAENPAEAYFVTHTRVWELALGGLIALMIHRPIETRWKHAGIVSASIGLALILSSAVLYDKATSFPGSAALAPTVGAGLIIAASAAGVGTLRILQQPLLTWVGDRSYSIYLWHWPLIAFATAQHIELGFMAGCAVVAVTLLLAHLSYEYIEQRFRHPRGKQERHVRPLGYALASIVACVVAVAAVHEVIETDAAVAAVAPQEHYPGPAALLQSVSVPHGVEARPPLRALKKDVPVTYSGERCHQEQKSSDPKSCVLGDPAGLKSMVIVGDSHAAQWVPALNRIAADNAWKLHSLTKSACPLSRVHLEHKGKPYESCHAWRENVITKIKQLKPDIVFTSQSRYEEIDREVMVNGLRSVWSELAFAGIRIVVIHDTPQMPFKSHECLSAGAASSCSAPRKDVQAGDTLAHAASSVDGVGFIDLTDGICSRERCDAVVGNVIVWRDDHHLTATYVAALAPYLAQKIGFTLKVAASSNSSK